MGLTISRAAESEAPPPSPALGTGGMPPPGVMPMSPFGPGGFPNRTKEEQEATPKPLDYSNLPQPAKYEDISRESYMILKPETFEGFRFDFTKPLNPNFFLTHGFHMGNMEMPTMGKEIIKTPVGNYEFGATVGKEGLLAMGRISRDGRMTSRLIWDLNDFVTFKLQSQFSNEPGPNMMMDIDFTGKNWNGQVKLGNGEFVGLNYFQSVTDKLALGGECFYLGLDRRTGFALAARHSDDTHAATFQIMTAGLMMASYSGRVNEQLALASELMYNWNAREATAQFGYDYWMRHCRLRARVDSNGSICALLEERMNMAVKFVLSGEVDYWKQNYKFGFGLKIGE
eukprot:TRINITY_DN4327_c1_g1_i1.p2 TRINITY_DN4327_c1_g1~~TRINITY_DN4327_c1_g1_i1.p2  ORF type:complete len:342 (+),score=69.90 TRINITY_DN4327_c1_g1_i1:379-1404(+)